MNTQLILGLIPARYGSTRFPGKPLANIGGKPMIQRVYEQTQKQLYHVYVATDDPRIEEAVKKFGGRVVMTSEKHQSGTDRCAEALTKIEKQENITFHAIINIQGDEPFINPAQIEAVTDCFNDPETQLATLVKPIDNKEDLFNPNKPKVVVDCSQQALFFSRSPIPYFRGLPESDWIQKHKYYNHIGLYGYRTDVLREITKLEQSPLELTESLEQLRWLENGYRIQVKETLSESISIDTPEDLENLIQSGLI